VLCAALSVIAALEDEWTDRLGIQGMQHLRELLAQLGPAGDQ
jgi:hypothetical protein